MTTTSPIRILEADNNRRGDLFGRLMTDLFLALGYEKSARLNVHKSGRELDLDAEHRTEHRRALAECKATADKIGGDDVNKFVGSLDAERRRANGQETVGYFISLSGFRETAIQQEQDLNNERVILLDGAQVVAELVAGHIIKSEQAAMERAGRCATTQPHGLLPEPTPELLAHDLGWIWAVYFTRNKQRTHFALIHADGEALAEKLAAEVIAADKSVGGMLHTLAYLAPTAEQMPPEQQIEKARADYFAYLARECGEIQLEGMPADEQSALRRLKLENIFVPLHLEPAEETAPDIRQQVITQNLPDIERTNLPSLDLGKRPSVGRVLSQFTRLALLGLPGGGKSTLLKRLAIAYAFPARRKLTDDELPDKPWLPLFIRCRQLEHLIRSPINTILREIPKRAEMDDDTAAAFAALVNRELRSGNVLLLIDGLDEISDTGARVAFIHQLRTFLATYPQVNTVVTSREAGFRIVGGALSTHCEHFKLAEFDDDDIKRLTRAWHREVVGDKPEVRADAETLAETICTTDRVRQLAQNPLLLTTLLLVKRWVGQLPTRRSILYGKALEVLLMTWNVEGYAPLDPEEINPQLEFIAYSMMQEGTQRISAKRLREILQLARQQMPEVLGYARVSVNEFIDRVELRSSILMQSGHEVEDGTLYPMYEFRHLTFQEYLTARAIVEGHYPNRQDSDNLLTILEPHLSDEKWREVVPLAAVLAGRKVQPLIQHLISLCQSYEPRTFERNKVPPADLLAQCILDEIQIPPDLLTESLRWIARRAISYRFAISLYRSKYGDKFLEICQNEFKNIDTIFNQSRRMLGQIALHQLGWNSKSALSSEFINKANTFIFSEDMMQKVMGALAICSLFQITGTYIEPGGVDVKRNIFNGIADGLFQLLNDSNLYAQYAAADAYGWLGAFAAWSAHDKPEIISRLLQLWSQSPSEIIKYIARDTIRWIPPIDREAISLPHIDATLLISMKEELMSHHEPYDASPLEILTVAFYLRAPWSDQELAQLVAEQATKRPIRFNYGPLLEALGEHGKPYLERFRRELDKAKQSQPADGE